MSDMKFTPSPCKLKLTSLACACLGTLTILGLGFGVFTCVSALSPGNNQPVYAADPTQQVDLSDPNIRVTYGVDGTMYVDIYVNDKDAFDLTGVNVNGEQSESSDPLDHGGDNDDDKPSSTTESNDSSDDTTEEQSTESTTEQSDSITEDEDSTDSDASSDTSSDIESESESGNNDVHKPSNDNDSMTDEEREILSSGKYLDNDEVYVVVWGDTLTEISNMTGFSVDFLAAYNHIENPNLIYAGESLRYPSLN